MSVGLVKFSSTVSQDKENRVSARKIFCYLLHFNSSVLSSIFVHYKKIENLACVMQKDSLSELNLHSFSK